MPILRRWAVGQQPRESEYKTLVTEELADARRAAAWNLTSENVLKAIEERSRLFGRIYPQIEALHQRDFPWRERDNLLLNLWFFWLPGATQIAAIKASQVRPLVQGIVGIQGTGKTTLTQMLGLVLEQMGFACLRLSLDDLYKTYRERQRLQEQDPRIIWRGPPGTHDYTLGINLLDRVRDRATPVWVPRFDKSAFGGLGERTTPEKVERAIDIVLFEGWFVGIRPVPTSAFEDPPPPIVSAADRQFALECNQRLQDYLPLWERLDRLIVLKPVDYRLSKQWRQQAEAERIALGEEGMQADEVEQFVEYFWRSLHPEIFIPPLLQEHRVDLVVEVSADHQPKAIYSGFALH